MAESSFDIVVVGGGPGGYPAAIRASQLGLRVALVEREHLGGICLNWGCIPTKALLRSSEIHHLLQHLDEFGFSAGEIRFDIGKIVKRSRRVAKRLAGGVSQLLKKNQVTVFDGRGRLPSKTVKSPRRSSSADLAALPTPARDELMLSAGVIWLRIELRAHVRW